MIHVECPNPAYRRIIRSGIDKRILKKKKRIGDLIMGGTSLGNAWPLHSAARIARGNLLRQKGRINETTELDHEILDIAERVDSDGWIDRDTGLFENPFLLGFTALGYDLTTSERFEFPNARSLAEAITSFCIGERELFYGYRGSNFNWRNWNRKNEIIQNEHGDLHVRQTDVSGEEWTEETLFGKETLFDTHKLNPPVGTIGAYQDWSQFLVSVLKYAEAIEQSQMPEITNWKDVLKEVGFVSTNSAEAISGSGGMYLLPFLFECPITIKGRKNSNPPAVVVGHRGEQYYLPYVSGDRLLYLERAVRGEFRIGEEEGPSLLTSREYKINIVFEPRDLPNLLRANYRLFARDRKLMTKIMDRFLETTK